MNHPRTTDVLLIVQWITKKQKYFFRDSFVYITNCPHWMQGNCQFSLYFNTTCCLLFPSDSHLYKRAFNSLVAWQCNQVEQRKTYQSVTQSLPVKKSRVFVHHVIYQPMRIVIFNPLILIRIFKLSIIVPDVAGYAAKEIYQRCNKAYLLPCENSIQFIYVVFIKMLHSYTLRDLIERYEETELN